MSNAAFSDVQENIRTISKQLQSAEDELEQFLNEQDQGDDYSMKPGLPMTEIIEELDEEGNVISKWVHISTLCGNLLTS